MDLIEIENLSFAELKAKRAELVEAAKTVPPEQLAERYVQARMDAKQRDEKLAEQGRTIALFQDSLAAVQKEVQAAQAEVAKWVAREPAVQEQVRGLAEEKEELRGLLRTTREQAIRLKTEALRNHAAVAQAAKLLNDALAAQAVDQADSGG